MEKDLIKLIHLLTISRDVIGYCLILNVVFSLLFFLGKWAGNGLVNWISSGDFQFLIVVIAPLFAVTHVVANELYEKNNWFIARVLLTFYIVIMLALTIACFSGFNYLIKTI